MAFVYIYSPATRDLCNGLLGEDKMRNLLLMTLAAVCLAACAGPTLNGQSDMAQLPGEPHVTQPTGPYDNTVNSLGGRYVGGGD
jgi:hypothetical protein